MNKNYTYTVYNLFDHEYGRRVEYAALLSSSHQVSVLKNDDDNRKYFVASSLNKQDFIEKLTYEYIFNSYSLNELVLSANLSYLKFSYPIEYENLRKFYGWRANKKTLTRDDVVTLKEMSWEDNDEYKYVVICAMYNNKEPLWTESFEYVKMNVKVHRWFNHPLIKAIEGVKKSLFLTGYDYVFTCLKRSIRRGINRKVIHKAIELLEADSEFPYVDELQQVKQRFDKKQKTH